MSILGKTLVSNRFGKQGGHTTSWLYRYLIKEFQGQRGLSQFAGGSK